MLKFGLESNMSGSTDSSPHIRRKGWELIITPEMAIAQIQSILDVCIKENASNLAINLIEAKTYFELNFPTVDGKAEAYFMFDELKEYVLEVLITQVRKEGIANLKHGSLLPVKLKEAADSWPTQKQYLTQKQYGDKKIKKINNALRKFKREQLLNKQSLINETDSKKLFIFENQFDELSQKMNLVQIDKSQDDVNQLARTFLPLEKQKLKNEIDSVPLKEQVKPTRKHRNTDCF